MTSKSYFNDVATEWDRMSSEFFSTNIRDFALKVSEIKNGEKAADLGAGTGFMTEALLKAGAEVIAVDQSEKMLEQLQKKFNSEKEIDSRVGEAGNLPVKEKSVDKAFANMYLHHVEKPDKAISEIRRILKPGGRMVLTDLEKHNFEVLTGEQHDRWMGFYLSDVRHWLEEAGFSNIIVGTVPGEKCCASSGSCNKETPVGVFMATGTA